MELRRYHSLIFLLQITGSYIELASDFYPYIENSVAENLATEIIDGIQKKMDCSVLQGSTFILKVCFK